MVKQIHPTAQEYEIKEGFLAYWIDDTPPPNYVPDCNSVMDIPRASLIVGVAWIDTRGRWNFVVMSQVARDIDVRCVIHEISPDRYRVLPWRAEETPTISRQIHAAKIRFRRLSNKAGSADPQVKDPTQALMT